jgi:hypothetical protein
MRREFFKNEKRIEGKEKKVKGFRQYNLKDQKLAG